MRTAASALLSLCLSFAAIAGQSKARFSSAPTASRSGGTTTISFALSAPTDVEVAILDANGKVVRHLAAGVLGGATPPPTPLKAGLSQSIEWDGKDDYGQPVPNASSCSARVRAGMGVKLERIVGGDPYAYYSREMGGGDHAAWRLMGLEVKPDGTVYVLGNANNYGPPALRAYRADGEYLRTLYPPPAGKPVEKMKGWGIHAEKNGTYSFGYASLASPALSKIGLCSTRGDIGRLLRSPETDKLLVEGAPRCGRKQFWINADGTVPADPGAGTPGPLVSEPAMQGVRGPMAVCPTPDRRHVFISGIYAAAYANRKFAGAKKDGFWRDGQVYKADVKTRKAEVFFALDAGTVITSAKERLASGIADAKYGPHAALQGAAVDKDGNVFVCDRQNERLLVLSTGAAIIREIPLKHGDMIAVHPRKKTLYVTTRFGHYHRGGELKLLKYGDWSKDTRPSAQMSLCAVRAYSQQTHLALVDKGDDVFVWVAYSALPVRVFRDTGAGLELVRDFYESGSKQRCLDMQHMLADAKTEHVYFADGFKSTFRITNWKEPRFERCLAGDKKPLPALSLAIDPRNRLLYAHDYMRSKVKHSLYRYRMDGKHIAPAPIGGADTHAISGGHRVSNDWRIGLGMNNRGIAVSPDGSVAALGATGHSDYSGPLYYFARNDKAVPWKPMLFECLGKPASAGIRFDPAGNLYVGIQKGGEWNRKIIRFAPTGTLAGGNLYPAPPSGPSKVYDIDYGYIPSGFSRTPRFGVDGYGRIYYPTSLVPRVSVIDNEGNAITRFGTYGNRDSMGGLEGDLVPTKDVPMAWPNSVDATDDYIYVSDIVNIRLMRLAKTFEASETVGIR